MITYSLYSTKFINVFSFLVSTGAFIAALYFAIKSGNPSHIILAYICPLLYLFMHFMNNNMSDKSTHNSNNDNELPKSIP